MSRRLFCIILFALSVFLTADAVVVRSYKLSRRDGLTSVYIRDIAQDATGFLWFGTPEGLYRYDGYNVVQIVPRTDEEKKLFPDMRIQEMMLKDGHLLLIRLRGNICCAYDTNRGRFVSAQEIGLKAGQMDKLLNDYRPVRDSEFARIKAIVQKYVAENPFIEISPYIKALYQDRQGNIFVSEENRGVVILSPLGGVAHYVYNGTNEMNHDNVIRTIYCNEAKELQLFSQYSEIVDVAEDPKGHVWFGTRTKGVIVDGKAYTHNARDPRSIGEGKVCSIAVDKKGRVWITLFSSGLYLAHPDGKGGYWFEHIPTKLYQPRNISLDKKGQLWICSSNGTLLFDPDTRKGRIIRAGTDNYRINETHHIAADRDSNIWVGTIGFGIGIFDNSKKGAPKLKRMITTADGLSDNRVQSIIRDKYNNMWVGTYYGLNLYEPRLKQWLRFYPGPTELSMIFSEASICRMPDESIALGTNHGVAIIKPDDAEKYVREEEQRAKGTGPAGYHLAITNMYVNGINIRDIIDIDDAVGVMTGQKDLTLRYDQNSIDVYVTDFDYRSGDRTTYQFWLMGRDKGWSIPQTSNHHLYDNLEPGTYTLLVKAHSGVGIELKQQIRLTIVIRQVWYLTWWAFVAYLLIIAGVGYAYWRHIRERQQLKNRIKVESELTKYKTIFFTNMSHEFRTPLTIISGAMEEVWGNDRLPSELKSPVVSMKRSTDRLMRLINQLMDFSRIHNGKLKLRVQETDAVTFSRNIYETFRVMAQQKNIDLSMHTSERSIIMPLDRNFFDKILYNLLGNAFKYTPAGGSVMLTLETASDAIQGVEGKSLVVKVTDTGIGVPKEKRQDLFSEFDQSAFVSDSVGLGLHLTKALVQAHHGTIAYEALSNPSAGNGGTGSIFTVTLPMEDGIYTEEERMKTSEALPDTSPDGANGGSAIPEEYKELMATPFNEKKTVLIVEDDADVQAFLQTVLGNHFTLITANNGQEGLDTLAQKEVDLVVTDIMMPVMSGMEMVRKMRSKKEFTTLPVIMLTAVASEEKQVKAYNLGVDTFMQKPFSPQILLAKVIQMLQREALLPTPLHGGGVNTDEGNEGSSHISPLPREGQGGGSPTIIIDSQDKRYREQFEHWLEQHLSDKDLGVEKFAEAMGMGRTAFFKRVKEITGKSPNEYIRQRRMERAMKLLADDSLSIQQVADQVGIDDAYYFSKIFKTFFGMSPSQYRKTGGQQQVESNK